MGRLRFTHNSFATGLINKKVQGNTEFEQYNNALRECINANVLPTGGIQKRGGSKFVSYLDSPNTRLLSLSYSVEESYILALSTYSLEIFTKYGKLDTPGGKIRGIIIVPEDQQIWYITDFNTLLHKTLDIPYPAYQDHSNIMISVDIETGSIFGVFKSYPSSYIGHYHIFKINKEFDSLQDFSYPIAIPKDKNIYNMRFKDGATINGFICHVSDTSATIVSIDFGSASEIEIDFGTTITLCDGIFDRSNKLIFLIGGKDKLSCYNNETEILISTEGNFSYAFTDDPYNTDRIYFCSYNFKVRSIQYIEVKTSQAIPLVSIPRETSDDVLLTAFFVKVKIPIGILVYINQIDKKGTVYFMPSKESTEKFLCDFTLRYLSIEDIFCSVSEDMIIISERKPTDNVTKSMAFQKVGDKIVYLGTFDLKAELSDEKDKYQSTMFVEPASAIPIPFLWDTIEYLPYIQNNDITFFFANSGIFVLEREASDQFKFFKYEDPFSIPPLTFLNESTTTLTPTATDTIGKYTIEASDSVFTKEDVGSFLVFLYTLDARLYTIYLEILEVVDDQNASVQIDNDLSSSPETDQDGNLKLPNLRPVGNWQIGCMNDTRGWPTAAALFEGRLFLCNTKSYATGIWGSNLGYNDLLNFAIESNASSGLQARIKIENCSTILWLVGINKLFLGTVGGICVIGSGTYQDEGLSPGKFVARFFDSTRPSQLPPVKVKDAIFFVDNSGANVYEIVLDSQLGAYKANNVSLLTNEYTSFGIISHAFMQIPYNSYWCALKNGELCSFTYQKNNNVLAWSRHKIAGNSASVTSVACLPFENKDHLFLVVTRLIDQKQVTTIEYISPPFNPIVDDPYTQHFCDSYITFEEKYPIRDIIKNKPSHIKSGAFPLYNFVPVLDEYEAIFLEKRNANNPLFIRGILFFDADTYCSFGDIDLSTISISKKSDISSILSTNTTMDCIGSGTNQENGITLIAINTNTANTVIIKSRNFVDWSVVQRFSTNSLSTLCCMENNYNNKIIPKFIFIKHESRNSTLYINTDGNDTFKQVINFPLPTFRIIGCCDIPGKVFFLCVGNNTAFGYHLELVSTTNFQAFSTQRININKTLSSPTTYESSSSMWFYNEYLLKFKFQDPNSQDSVLVLSASTGMIVYFNEFSDFTIYQQIIYVRTYNRNTRTTTIKTYKTLNDLNLGRPINSVELKNKISSPSFFKMINGSLCLVGVIDVDSSLKGKLVLCVFDPTKNKITEQVFDNIKTRSISLQYFVVADYSDNPGDQYTALACKAAPFKLKNFEVNSFEIYRQFVPNGPLIGFDFASFNSVYPNDASSSIEQKPKYYCAIKLTEVTRVDRDHITAKTDKLVRNMWVMLSGNDFNPEKASFDSLASKQMYLIDRIEQFKIFLKNSLGEPVFFDNNIDAKQYGLNLYAVIQDNLTFTPFEFYFESGKDAEIIISGNFSDYKVNELIFIRKVVSPNIINNKEFRISAINEYTSALQEIAISVWDIENSIVSNALFAPLDISQTLDYNPFLEDNGFLYKSINSVTAKHLANQEVVVMCDGNYIGKSIVSSDGTLLLKNPATSVVVGLEYTMTIETTPLSGGSQVGSSIGGVTSQKEIVLSLYYSLGGRYGTEKSNSYPIPYKRKVQLNKPQELFTGNLLLPVIKSKNIYERCTYLEHSEPVNFTVLSLTEETSVSDS